jgi:hypothetical protein
MAGGKKFASSLVAQDEQESDGERLGFTIFPPIDEGHNILLLKTRVKVKSEKNID